MSVPGKIVEGHRVASGQAHNSPYPEGTISMQLPVFKALGLDTKGLWPGTLNIFIAPYSFKIVNPKYTFLEVCWWKGHPPETFLLTPCSIMFNSSKYLGYIYYPHPETKVQHFQDESTLEIIAPWIPDAAYGDQVLVEFSENEVNVYKA